MYMLHLYNQLISTTILSIMLVSQQSWFYMTQDFIPPNRDEDKSVKDEFPTLFYSSL